MTNIYVREFLSGGYVSVQCNSNYRLSKYLPHPMKNALKRCALYDKNIPLDNYIIGPFYRDRDLQIGVTGTTENKEEEIATLERELGEEVGIVPKTVQHIRTYDWAKQGSFSVYKVHISDCLPVLDSQHGICYGKGDDDKTRKIGCFVYGTKEEILNFLNLPRIYIYKSNDDIIGIGAVRVGDVI
jgi:hypothetical protein